MPVVLLDGRGDKKSNLHYTPNGCVVSGTDCKKLGLSSDDDHEEGRNFFAGEETTNERAKLFFRIWS